jgi:Ca-activated chloride channel homolog
MKRLLLVFVCVSVSAISVLAQSTSSTRARIVTATPTPTPPKIQNDSPATQQKRPPVLSGGVNKPLPPPPPLPEKPVEDDEIITIETNLVTMPVSVLDRNGRFISGLRKEDFKIYENGVEQKIDIFASVEQPFTVVLLLDMSNSTQFHINEIQNAAIVFVSQLRSNDKVMVISFDEEVHVLTPPTNNRNTLRNAIMQTRFGGGTSLYDAVDLVINQELQRIEGRKAIVLFTDGVDTTSRRSDYLRTLRDTEEVDALIYPIHYDTFNNMNPGGSGGGIYYPRRRRGGGGGGTLGDILGDILSGGVTVGGRRGGGRRGSGTSRAEYETGRRYLEDLARYSGGRSFEASSTSNLEVAFSGIAEELRRQYSLGYYPETVGQKGERKQIRVRVMRPGLVVRAKNSYIVGASDKKVAGK